MPEIHRSALVMYSPQQMFDLVVDVERYPEFLGWIEEAWEHERSDSHQLASMRVSVAGVSVTLTTRNRLEPGRLVELNLEKGPFRRFGGAWRFSDLGAGSKVELKLEINFDQPVLMSAFNRSFMRVADRMVDDFCRRAETLYG